MLFVALTPPFRKSTRARHAGNRIRVSPYASSRQGGKLVSYYRLHSKERQGQPRGEAEGERSSDVLKINEKRRSSLGWGIRDVLLYYCYRHDDQVRHADKLAGRFAGIVNPGKDLCTHE